MAVMVPAERSPMRPAKVAAVSSPPMRQRRVRPPVSPPHRVESAVPDSSPSSIVVPDELSLAAWKS